MKPSYILDPFKIKFIERLENIFPRGKVPLEEWLLSIDCVSYGRMQGVGKKKVKVLNHIKAEAASYLHKEENVAIINPAKFEFSFNTLNQLKFLFDKNLRERTIHFVSTLNTCQRDVFNLFFGIVGRIEETTKDVMSRYEISESRVSQIRSDIKSQYADFIDFPKEDVSKAIAHLICFDIGECFSLVAEIVVSNKHLVRLIECALRFEECSTIESNVKHTFRTDCLSFVYSNNFLPLTLHSFFEILHLNHGVLKYDFWKILSELKQSSMIKIENHSIIWMKVSLNALAANVALKYPEGRKSKDLFEEVRSISVDAIEESEDGHYRFVTDNPHLYAIRKGVYKHRKFFSLNSQQAEIAKNILQGLDVEKSNYTIAEIYNSNKVLWSISPFDFEEFVKIEIESGNLLINISEDDRVLHKMQLTKNQILNLFESSNRPFSLEDISEIFPNYNSRYLFRLISLLSEDKKLFRINESYLVPSKNAVDQSSKVKFEAAILAILDDYPDGIFEVSYLAFELNSKNGISLDKFFLISFLKTFMEKKVYVTRQLISKKPIPFDSLSDYCRKIAHTCVDVDDLKDKVSKTLKILPETISGSLTSWMSLYRDKFIFSKAAASELSECLILHSCDDLFSYIESLCGFTTNESTLILLDNELQCEQLISWVLTHARADDLIKKFTINTFEKWLLEIGDSKSMIFSWEFAEIRSEIMRYDFSIFVGLDDASQQSLKFGVESEELSPHIIFLPKSSLMKEEKVHSLVIDDWSEVVQYVKESSSLIPSANFHYKEMSSRIPLLIVLRNSKLSVIKELQSLLERAQIEGIKIWHSESPHSLSQLEPNVIIQTESEKVKPFFASTLIINFSYRFSSKNSIA